MNTFLFVSRESFVFCFYDEFFSRKLEVGMIANCLNGVYNYYMLCLVAETMRESKTREMEFWGLRKI